MHNYEFLSYTYKMSLNTSYFQIATDFVIMNNDTNYLSLFINNKVCCNLEIRRVK